MKYLGVTLLLLGLNFLIVRNFSVRHPFLDADNRHYAQKFYKYVIATNAKYALVPIYTFILLFLNETFKDNLTSAYLFSYILCSSITLVLTPLFELRYFIIPWYMLYLSRPLSSSFAYLNLAYFAAVNGIVLYVFVKKPFLNVYFDNEMSRFFW